MPARVYPGVSAVPVEEAGLASRLLSALKLGKVARVGKAASGPLGLALSAPALVDFGKGVVDKVYEQPELKLPTPERMAQVAATTPQPARKPEMTPTERELFWGGQLPQEMLPPSVQKPAVQAPVAGGSSGNMFANGNVGDSGRFGQDQQTGALANPNLDLDIDKLQLLAEHARANQMKGPVWDEIMRMTSQPTAEPRLEAKPYEPKKGFFGRLGDTLTGGRARYYQDENQRLQNEALAQGANLQADFRPAEQMILQALLQQGTGTDVGIAGMYGQQPAIQSAERMGGQQNAAQLAGMAMKNPIGLEPLQQLLEAAGVGNVRIPPEAYAELLKLFQLQALNGNIPFNYGVNVPTQAGPQVALPPR